MLEITKEKFRLFFELSKKQPWIVDKFDALQDLLWNECDEQSKRDLVSELIERFVYISQDKYFELVESLTNKIIGEEALTDKNTQIVAMAADSCPDSSQYLLYDLKICFWKQGWSKHKQVNTFGGSYKTYKKDSNYKNIVLVDEFIGTGCTVINRVKALRKVYGDAGVNDFSIFVKVLAGTDQGIKTIREEGVNVEALITLEKGISDYYEDKVAEQKKYLMLQLEQLLAAEYETQKLPSLGYGQTESLYSRQNGNVPNSVFPIFWWPFLRSGNSRKVLLTRAMESDG